MDIDPMEEVIKEGGPFHTRGQLATYVKAFRTRGRDDIAQRMIDKYKDNPCYI